LYDGPEAGMLGAMFDTAAAAMLAACLERGLRPEWSAADPISKHLAISLGYRPAALCDIFYLE
jgi:hypothetical protein